MTVDQVRVSARAFKCLLVVTLRPIHSELKGANAVHRTFDEHGIILSDRLLIYLGNDLDLIIKGCVTDEVRYRLIAILLLALLKDSLLLRGETDVVEISPSLNSSGKRLFIFCLLPPTGFMQVYTITECTISN